MPYCRPPRVRKPWTGSAVWRASLSKPQLWACWPPRSFTCRPARSRSGSTLGCSISGRSSIRRRRTPESSSPRPTRLRTLHASPLSPTTTVRSSSSARCGSRRPRRSSACSVPSSSPVDGRRSQPTEWPRGGHLWFETELDGVDTARPAARLTRPAAAVARRVRRERRRSRQRALRALRRIRCCECRGSTHFRHCRQPRRRASSPAESSSSARCDRSMRRRVGVAAAPQLVAQMLTSHLGGYYILDRPQAALGAWAIALLLCVPFLFAASTRIATLVLLPVATAVLPAASALAFYAFALWLPVTGPAAWVLVTSALLVLRQSRAKTGRAIARCRCARPRAARGRRRAAQGSLGAVPPAAVERRTVPGDLRPRLRPRRPWVTRRSRGSLSSHRAGRRGVPRRRATTRARRPCANERR